MARPTEENGTTAIVASFDLDDVEHRDVRIVAVDKAGLTLHAQRWTHIRREPSLICRWPVSTIRRWRKLKRFSFNLGNSRASDSATFPCTAAKKPISRCTSAMSRGNQQFRTRNAATATRRKKVIPPQKKSPQRHIREIGGSTLVPVRGCYFSNPRMPDVKSSRSVRRYPK